MKRHPVLAFAVVVLLGTSCAYPSSDESTPEPVERTTNTTDAAAPVGEPATTADATTEPTPSPATSAPASNAPGNRTTAGGISIAAEPSESGENRLVRATAGGSSVALEFLPDLPGPDGALDAHGWVGDGRIALFAATAASAVAEVQLLDGSEIIDRVSPDETGLALVAGTGDLSTLIVVAVDGQGTPLATCSRDPEYTSLLACAPA